MLRLIYEREKRGWSKTDLAYEAKIHPSYIGKLESGKIYPYNSFKEKLSKVFGISGDELFKEITIKKEEM